LATLPSAIPLSFLPFYLSFLPSEVAGNSVERVQEYLDPVPKEKEASPSGVPPAYWPSSGDIHISNLSARYSEGGPVVLEHINLTINSGEMIGVAGRTGRYAALASLLVFSP
jgi:ABC-type multidrug transport system fused ATPase/permease subunit